MTLFTLLFNILIVAVVLMGVHIFLLKKEVKNYILTFLQYFVGALFVFSGAVKAIDPLGTAYKMEQYFAQFESTFSETWMSVIAPIFPALSKISVTFAVLMIVFEIVLGIMLIIGSQPKRTAWAFFVLVVFFTFLTGFTYLTGYVPQSGNFFSFSTWESFNEANMRVTDCGCFGDFLKLKPKVSFLKDIFLLIPGIFFIISAKQSHQWFTEKTRSYITIGTTIFITFFCLYNFMYDLPIVDFRPFKNGTDVRTEKSKQEQMAAEAKISFIYRNPKDTTEMKTFSEAELDKIPAGWEYFDRIQEEVEGRTKISDFVGIQGEMISKTTYLLYDTGDGEPYLELAPEDTADGGIQEGWVFVKEQVSEQVIEGDVTEKILNNPNPHFMIVCHDLKKVNKNAFATKIATLQKEAEAKGIEIYAVIGKASTEEMKEFQEGMGVNFPFYTADDILLKTIIRSNPGIVLWKDGVILQKWHYRHLPTMEVIEATYLKK